MRSYKTAIISTTGYGEGLLDRISKNDRYELCALFDRNKIHCKELADKYQIQPFDDYRQLILSAKPELIIMNLPNYQAEECIQTASNIGSNIFKTSPVARDLSEAHTWTSILKKNNCAIGCSCPTRFNPLTDKLIELINTDNAIGTLYHSSVNHFFQFQDVFDWRGDMELSGGGVMLEGAFQYIDLITRLNGIPQRIFSVNTNLCKKVSLPPYFTEDTAVITMEYNDRSIANISCGWMAGCETHTMQFYGTQGSIHCTQDTLTQYNRTNEVIAQFNFEIDQLDIIAAQLDTFADHLDKPEFNCKLTAENYYNTIAIINTAYLSATTKSPEDPAKIMGHM